METPFDYFFNHRTNPTTIEALRSERLAAALEKYTQRLREDGYAAHTGFVHLRLLGCFNKWLRRQGLKSAEVNCATIEQYRPEAKRETPGRRFSCPGSALGYAPTSQIRHGRESAYSR